MMAVQRVRIIFKRKLASEWVSENPILMKGEPGYEEDTGRMKIGNGINRWNVLPYFRPDQDIAVALQAHLDDPEPHSVYDDGPSLVLLYENKKV